MMDNISQAKEAINRAWVQSKSECLSVLGSELHYQAMIYHSLRTSGAVPISQIGMNVKMMINDPSSELFKDLTEKRHVDYRSGFEPIPDVVLFSTAIGSDWRRRNQNNTLLCMLAAVEIKASERANSRLRPKEIKDDIWKLAAHREEVLNLGSDFAPVMMIIDSAPDPKELMTETAVNSSKDYADESGVGFLYISKWLEINTLQEGYDG
jgi:hypothetical protein